MVNLRFLELNIRSMLVAAFTGNTTLEELSSKLKSQLLSSVPSGVLQKKGVRGCGVWLTVSVNDSYLDHLNYMTKFSIMIMLENPCSDNMHKIGEGWREVGINLQLQDSVHPPEPSDSANSHLCYYG